MSAARLPVEVSLFVSVSVVTNLANEQGLTKCAKWHKQKFAASENCVASRFLTTYACSKVTGYSMHLVRLDIPSFLPSGRMSFYDWCCVLQVV